MQEKTEVFWAYLAGLFDGEGNLGLYKEDKVGCHKGYTWRFMMSISNTDKVLIDSLFQELQAGFIRAQKQGTENHSTLYKLGFIKAEQAQILAKIMPYSRSKKQVIELILKAYPIHSKREEIYEQLNKMKNPNSIRGRPRTRIRKEPLAKSE